MVQTISILNLSLPHVLASHAADRLTVPLEFQSGSSQRESSESPSSITGHNAPKFGTLVPNRVFIGGIPPNTTEVEMAQFFSKFGTVRATKIILDRAGVSKGYGFITFESEEQAQNLIREGDCIIFKERKLNIAHAIRKQQPFSRMLEPLAGIPSAPGALICPNGISYTFQNGVAMFSNPSADAYVTGASRTGTTPPAYTTSPPPATGTSGETSVNTSAQVAPAPPPPAPAPYHPAAIIYGQPPGPTIFLQQQGQPYAYPHGAMHPPPAWGTSAQWRWAQNPYAQYMWSGGGMVGGTGEYMSTTPVASETSDNPGTPNSRSCCSTPAPSCGGGGGNDGTASGISDSPTSGKSKANCNTEHPAGKGRQEKDANNNRQRTYLIQRSGDACDPVKCKEIPVVSVSDILAQERDTPTPHEADAEDQTYAPSAPPPCTYTWYMSGNPYGSPMGPPQPWSQCPPPPAMYYSQHPRGESYEIRGKGYRNGKSRFASRRFPPPSMRPWLLPQYNRGPPVQDSSMDSYEVPPRHRGYEGWRGNGPNGCSDHVRGGGEGDSLLMTPPPTPLKVVTSKVKELEI
ncbi:unnamed protein product [Darwinula stevensoni]|uniref:RRM domain-containing protein n=1 Tax=Darwinula stevensoni TaxID=69355 RepID=A0A7R8X0N3_9CRUS|nr:unnamed protein product [Darwinula stevensoni]CAG0881349.1 unnamed protein product [Darwinula stevensoni]